MLETLTIWVTGASAVYLLIIALTVQTKNFISALLFKVIPFFLGLFSAIATLKMLGIL